MVGAGREVEEERFVGRDLLEVGDEFDGLVGQIDGEVKRLWLIEAVKYNVVPLPGRDSTEIGRAHV